MVSTANTIFRDFVTDGVPSSGANKPAKSAIRSWGTYLESLYSAAQAGGGLAYQTKAALDADLAHTANQIAWVLEDGIAANNGIYQKVGASGSGSWARLGDLPYNIVHAENSGAGTANAVEATSDVALSTSAYAQLISVNFTAANTGAMTLSINGETARDLVTNTGSAIASGYVQSGMSALVQLDTNGDYRFFTYGDASAVEAAAQGYADAAATSASQAASAASSITFPAYTPERSGAIGDGSTDDHDSVAAADAYCQTNGLTLNLLGNYKVGSDLVIKSPVVSIGGKFTLPAGVKLTLEGGLDAGDLQVFVYADRTSKAYVHNSDFRAYWWGVDMYYDEGTTTWRKLDNNIPLQYALDSVAGSQYDPTYPHTWEGGTIHFPAGYCFMQAGVTMHGNQTLRGAGFYTSICPDTAGWDGTTDYLVKMFKEVTGTATISIASPAVITSTAHGLSAGQKVFFTTTGALPTGIVADTEYYVLAAGLTSNAFEISATDGGTAINTSGSQSGTHTWHKGVSQFNTRLENLRLWGNGGFLGVNHQVLAWSPQEDCGCFNVWFASVLKYGLTYQRGYGGASWFHMDGIYAELDPACSAVAKHINIDMAGATTAGWEQFALNNITVAGAAVPTPGTDEWTGIAASGRVVVNINGAFAAEDLIYGILLDDDACLTGNGIQGNVGSEFVIALNSGWNANGESFVDCLAKKGNTTTLLKDYTAKGYTLYADDVPGGHIIMPPDPNKAIASIAVENGSTTPTVAYSVGRLSAPPTTPSTGVYRFTMDTALHATGDYRARVDFEYPNGANYVLTPYVSRNGAGTFDVTFRDASGVAQYVDQFQVHLLHVP